MRHYASSLTNFIRITSNFYDCTGHTFFQCSLISASESRRDLWVGSKEPEYAGLFVLLQHPEALRALLFA